MPIIKTPVEFIPDPGRILTAKERAEVAPTITPITQIKRKVCAREDTNDKWRNGKC